MNVDNDNPSGIDRGRFPISFESLLTIFALVVSLIAVDMFYSAVVEPRYDTFRQLQQDGQIASDANSVWVVLSGFEQKATLILFFASLFLLAFKTYLVVRERGLLGVDFLDLPPGRVVERTEAVDLIYEMENQVPATRNKFARLILPNLKNSLIPRALRRGLTRYYEDKEAGAEDVSHSISSACEGEMVRNESQLAMINYIAWAIPSVGFIGTVRGIAEALNKAGDVVQTGNVMPVTAALGLAFNSTLIALILSMFLMAFLYGLRRLQEGLVIDAEAFAQDRIHAIF